MIGEIIKRLRPIRFILFKLLYTNKYSEPINKFKNIKEGKTVVIVCNGPSLNKVKLEKIKHDSIGLNKIDLIFNKTNWRPNYIVSINGLVIEQNKDKFKELKIPIFLDFKAKFIGLSGKNIYYLLSDYSRKFSNNISKKIGSAGTVTYAAIQLAVFLGYKKIMIIGMDHSFKGYDNKKSISKIEKFEDDDLNHFDKNYFKGNLWGTPNLFISEVGYKKARLFCEMNNILIRDLTIGGKCDIFQKGKIEDIYD